MLKLALKPVNQPYLRPMLVMKSFFFLSLSTSENSLHFNFSSLVTKRIFFWLERGRRNFLISILVSTEASRSISTCLYLFWHFSFLDFWRVRKKKVLVSGKRNLQQIPFSRNKNFFFVHPFWRWIAHLVQNVHTAKSRRCAEKKTFHHKDRPDDGHANGWPWPPPACRRSSYLLLLLPLHEAEAKQLL